jgi:flagellar M-ring protein FliF
MLRSMLKSSAPAPSPAPASEAETTAAAAAAAASEEAAEEPQTVKLPRRKFSSTGPNLRDELREIVKEDPDAAATVLRAWIGDAA